MQSEASLKPRGSTLSRENSLQNRDGSHDRREKFFTVTLDKVGRDDHVHKKIGVVDDEVVVYSGPMYIIMLIGFITIQYLMKSIEKCSIIELVLTTFVGRGTQNQCLLVNQCVCFARDNLRLQLRNLRCAFRTYSRFCSLTLLKCTKAIALSRNLVVSCVAAHDSAALLIIEKRVEEMEDLDCNLSLRLRECEKQKLKDVMCGAYFVVRYQ